MIGYANPKRFLDASRSLPRWLFAIAAIFLGVGLYLSLFVVPPERQQGDAVKILTGIKEGERVATSNLADLYDGAQVAVSAAR